MNVDQDHQTTGEVIGAAISVHRDLGPGVDEAAYEAALSLKLHSLGVAHACQVPLPICYRGTLLDCGYRYDLLIESRLPIELKAVEQILPMHQAQLLTYVDRNGLNMPRVGDLPLGCAAVCNASISVQRLAVEAAVHGDDALLRQAFMMDPLVGAVCNPPEIWQLVDEMLIAGARWLPQYRRAIAAAKKRMARGPLIRTNGSTGAARKKIRSLKELATIKGNPRQGH